MLNFTFTFFLSAACLQDMVDSTIYPAMVSKIVET